MDVAFIAELAGLLLLCAVLFEAARILGLLWKSRRMTRAISVFEQHSAHARARILLVGDSTGYGTGTTDARHSITGRIAADFPDAHIENWSETGSKLGYVLKKLRARLPGTPPFDLVIIMAGGMDVVHRVPIRRLRRTLAAVIAEAKAQSRTVIFVAPHNAGRVPMFRWPIAPLNVLRAQTIERQFADVCAREGVTVVSLYDTNATLAARSWYSHDKTHPNDAGYGFWYERIRPAIEAALERSPVVRYKDAPMTVRS